MGTAKHTLLSHLGMAKLERNQGGQAHHQGEDQGHQRQAKDQGKALSSIRLALRMDGLPSYCWKSKHDV